MFATHFNVNRLLHFSSYLNAGHSKWANIRHIKALKDGQKSLLFTKLGRQIRLSIQEGGGSTSPELNSKLRSSIDEALKKSMPQATIQGILKKHNTQGTLKKHLVEVKVLNKIFMVGVVYTENYTGVKMNIASQLKKHGSYWSETRHLFTDRGLVQALAHERHTKDMVDSLEEVCTEDAIECGAEDVEIIDEPTKLVNFVCDPTHLDRVKKELMAKKYEIENTEHVFIPHVEIQINEMERNVYEKLKEKLRSDKLIDEIYDNVEDLEDKVDEAERKRTKN